MTDEQTAAEIMKSLWIKTRRDSAGKSMDYWIGGTFRGTVEEAMKDRADIEAAIVRALQAAREEGRKSAMPVIHNVEEFYRETTSDGK